LVRSPALRIENDCNPREDRRLAASLWLDHATIEATLTDEAAGRGGALVALGFAPLDALHVALAEATGARWLATCDDRLISLGRRHASDLRVTIVNPCDILTR
jgi:hypothetical protein